MWIAHIEERKVRMCLCHAMGAPTAAPIVPKPGQQTLLLTRQGSHIHSILRLRPFRGHNGGPTLHMLHQQ